MLKNKTRTLVAIVLICASYIACNLPLNIAHAESAKNTNHCIHNKGIGAVFYDFDKIIVYYAGFPSPSWQENPSYPQLLKYEEFNERLIQNLELNFEECLKTKVFLSKEIAVIPPYRMRRDNKSTISLAEIQNPRNLTLVVRLKYLPGHSQYQGIEEFGMLSYEFYRPNMSGLQAIPLISNKSRSMAFFPKQGAEALEKSLDTFFKAMRPFSLINERPWPSILDNVLPNNDASDGLLER